MAILTRKDLETVQRLQVKNILQKQASGKTLTAREERILAEAAVTSEPAVEAGNFAKNWDELATRLNISRRGLQKVRSRFADKDLPEPKPDGRHEVAAWSKFFADHNIKASAIDAEPSGEDDELVTTSEAEWRKRLLREKVESARLANETARREAIPLSEIQETLPAFLMTIRTDLNQVVADLAADLEGIDDYNEREEIIQKRVNQLLGILARCDYLDEKPPPADDAGVVNKIRIKSLEKSKREAKPPAKEKTRLKREAKAQKPAVRKTRRK